MRTTMARAWAFTLLAALLSLPVFAGQVRVDVSNGTNAMIFSPATVAINNGDQVVWVWISGNHSVTSGLGANCTPSGDGRFNSSTVSRNATNGTAFTWKSNVTGALPYYCIPHCDMMVGTLNVGASGAAVSDFRITEVQYNVAGGLDLIEISNLGTASGDLGRYRFVASHDSATVPADHFIVGAGQRVTVHVNAAGAQAAPGDLYLPTLTDLPLSGALALYVPNTINTNLNDVTQIIDFVQWGAGGQGREATAALASLWTAGEFLPTMAPGHSIEFCASAGQYGRASWGEISTPNFGSDGNCLTNSLRTTWGKLKQIYR